MGVSSLDLGRCISQRPLFCECPCFVSRAASSSIEITWDLASRPICGARIPCFLQSVNCAHLLSSAPDFSRNFAQSLGEFALQDLKPSTKSDPALQFLQLHFVQRTLNCALRHQRAMLASQPSLGVSSLDFGPLLVSGFFFAQVLQTSRYSARRG